MFYLFKIRKLYLSAVLLALSEEKIQELKTKSPKKVTDNIR